MVVASSPARPEWWAPQTARPLETLVGAKPPWNQPHEMPLALRRSPTFVPAIVIMFVVCNFGLVRTQSSRPGRGSPMTEPVVFPPAILPLGLEGAPFGRFAT